MSGRTEPVKSVLHNIISYWICSFKLPVSIVNELERIFANFIWNNKMHAWKWSDLCRPKKEGVGIRRVADLNMASGIRLFWRFTPGSAWATWMKEHYLKDQQISQAFSTLLNSGSWKWMVEVKESLSCMQVQVADSGFHSWIWIADKSGSFTFSFSWSFVRQHHQCSPLFNMVWFPNHCPKMSLCLLRALSGKLLTRSFLRSLDIIQVDHCVLCKADTETVTHLLLIAHILRTCGSCAD